jgi:hypothetical protein
MADVAQSDGINSIDLLFSFSCPLSSPLTASATAETPDITLECPRGKRSRTSVGLVCAVAIAARPLGWNGRSVNGVSLHDSLSFGPPLRTDD